MVAYVGVGVCKLLVLLHSDWLLLMLCVLLCFKTQHNVCVAVVPAGMLSA
jgi:hypothetical protein